MSYSDGGGGGGGDRGGGTRGGKSRSVQKLITLMKKVSVQPTDASTQLDQQQGDLQQQPQQQEDVQLAAASGPFDASTADVEPQVLPGSSDKKHLFGSLRGLFRRKKSPTHHGEQAECVSGTKSQLDPAAGDLIAAMRAPAGVELQVEASTNIITAGANSNDQVRSL